MEEYRRPRRASLTLGPPQPAPEGASLDEQDEEDRLADIKALEALCARTTARCHAHEQLIASLEHDIEQRISRWSQMTSLLQEFEARAQGLTEHLRASIHTLRTVTSTQINSTRQSVVKAEDRVGQSRKSLEDAEETIREAKAAIIVLEGRMADEETTQEKIRVYNQLVLWFSCICVILPSVILAWWLARPESK